MSEESSQHEPSVTHTAELKALFAVDREQRDDAWTESFLELLPFAAMKSSEERVFNGPDGFLYYGLFLPEEGETFSAVSLLSVLEFCTKEGLGIAVFGEQPNDPEWVFNYGSIWNFSIYSKFYENPFAQKLLEDGAEQEDRSETVLVATPSEEFLPLFVRAVLLRDLEQQQVTEPSMLLMTVPGETSYLVFNVFPTDFDEEHFEFIQQYLMWALPQGFSIASVEENSELSEHFVKLREMLESPLN